MVVVSINYRQTIFGKSIYFSALIIIFLGGLSFARPTPDVADVQLALEWVNKTIKNFNGDASQVTLMGSRRGAQIASYLSRMPKARGLSHLKTFFIFHF
jgi:carboxylesterase type B